MSWRANGDGHGISVPGEAWDRIFGGEVRLTSERGVASGHSVLFDHMSGRWQWSAFGPDGGEHGDAASEDVAMIRARAAEQWLKRGRA